MDDSNSTNLTIIVVLLLFIVGISIFSFSLKFTSKNNANKKSNNEEIINEDTSVDYNNKTYKVYKSGDSIKLSDNSSWHVIKDSSSNEEEVTILSDNDIGKINTKDVENYLEETYYNQLQENLSIDDNSISNIRLIDIDDIMTLTSLSNITVGTKMEKQGLEWLYSKSTLTSYIEDSKPILICSKDGENPARICIGKDSDIFPIRPVITISKNYISK